MGRQWRFWAGLLVSVAALVLAVLGVDLAGVVDALVRAEVAYLLPAAAGILGFLVARSVRWHLLLGSSASVARCFWVTSIGYLVSNVLPFRLGDPARAVVIGRGGRGTAAALSTVAVERVLDMLVILALLAGVVLSMDGARVQAVLAPLRAAGSVAAIAAVGALAVLLFATWRPEVLRRVLARPGHARAQRWAKVVDGLLDGLVPLRSGRRAAGVLAWSVATWACVVGAYWALLRAFLPRPPALAAPFLVGILSLGVALPSSPGAAGVFHAVARYGLTVPFDVPQEEAVAIAFAIHGFQYLTMSLLGVAGLARESLSLRWLRGQADRMKGVE